MNQFWLVAIVIVLWTKTKSINAVAVPCPDGYSLLSEMCIFISNGKQKNFCKAEHTCNLLGGQIIRISTAKKLQFSLNMWVGVSRLLDQNWRKLNGEVLTQKEKDTFGLTARRDGKRCAAVRNGNFLYTLECNERLSFRCELGRAIEALPGGVLSLERDDSREIWTSDRYKGEMDTSSDCLREYVEVGTVACAQRCFERQSCVAIFVQQKNRKCIVNDLVETELPKIQNNGVLWLRYSKPKKK